MKRGYTKRRWEFSQISTTLRSSKQTDVDNEYLIYSEILRESLLDEKFILNYIYIFRKNVTVCAH